MKGSIENQEYLINHQLQGMYKVNSLAADVKELTEQYVEAVDQQQEKIDDVVEKIESAKVNAVDAHESIKKMETTISKENKNMKKMAVVVFVLLLILIFVIMGNPFSTNVDPNLVKDAQKKEQKQIQEAPKPEKAD